jgi:cation-transporting ATPase 13A3/4/5
LAATCGTGLSFCGDGTCQVSCDGIANACQCGDETVNYHPCAANQLVNITQFDPVNQVVQTQNICASNGNFSSLTIGTWGTFDSAYVWLYCPVVDPMFTWTEPMWLAVWSLMGAEAAILILWAVYKSLREIKFHQASNLSSNSSKTVEIDESECKLDLAEDEKRQHKSAPDTITTDSLSESEKLHFRGFQTDYFGLFAFGSVVVTTLLFFVFLGCLVGDYCTFFVTSFMYV